jgi:myosin-crossreactive antigen
MNVPVQISNIGARPVGTLDCAGNAADVYVLRGGRMIESTHVRTLVLLDSIPTLDGRATVIDEIACWSKTMKRSPNRV